MAPRLTLLTVLCTLSLFVCAQQNAARINSGELLEKGIRLYDDGKYKEALMEFDKIPEGDTNYVWALYEAALTCSMDSQYNRGIAYLEKGLADKSDLEREPEMLLLYGSLFDYSNQPERALQILDSALKVYPSYLNLYITKGTTLLRMEKYAEAEKVYQQAAMISPYSANLHHKLGLAALNQGKVIQGFLCMLASLTIEPDSRYYKNAISILNEISKSTDYVGELLKKRTGAPSGNFALVEQIVLSKIALDKNYKLSVDLEDNIVRQMQVLFEKLEYNEDDPDFYMQYYVPLYKKIFDDKRFTPFVYYVFSGVELEAVRDYNKKKRKEIDALKSELVDYFNLLRATRELQYAKRDANGPIYHFADGKAFGKGVIKTKDIFTGYWTFTFAFGNKKAEGLFNAKGEKEGKWLYYYFNGQLKGEEFYRDGKQEGAETYYYNDGAVSSRATYKNGKPEGQYIFYYGNGMVKSTEPYSNGQLNGVKKTYYPAGPLQMEETFVNGKRHGPLKNYHINGQAESVGAFADGELHGEFKGWNRAGTLVVEGTYSQGNPVGAVKRYNENGKLQSVENYDNKGVLEGEYIAYHENGKLSYRYVNKKGKTTGDINYYDVDGKLYSTLTYDDDRLRAGRYFDKTGKQISHSEIKKGKLELATYSVDGVKQTVAIYNDKGVLEGAKIYYYGSGREKMRETYTNGSLNGEVIGYHPSGKKSYAVTYVDGAKSGYYQSWYANGSIQEEGWYEDNELQGEWLSYDKYGALTSSSWYLNGARHGIKKDYWPNGRAHTVYKYEMDRLMSIIEYDTTGKVINIVKLPNGNGKCMMRYPNGKLFGENNYVNGEMHGPSVFYYPDGSKMTVRNYKHGLLDSNYTMYSYGGKVRVEGRYEMNEKEGPWKYYTDEGVMYCKEAFRAGKTAKSLYYFKDGKLDTEIEKRNGERHGLYKRYAEDGSLMYQVRYDYGLPVGYSYLDKNGKPVPEIPLVLGSGKVKAFYQNGNPSAVMAYVDGVLHGDYTLYHPTGKVWLTDKQHYGDTEGARVENYGDGKIHTMYTFKHDNMHGPYAVYNADGVVTEEGNYYDDNLHGEQRFYDKKGDLRQVRYYYYGLLLHVK